MTRSILTANLTAKFVNADRFSSYQDGSVTAALATAEQLRSLAVQWRDWAARAQASAQELRRQADDRYAAAGAVLVAGTADWSVPAELRDTVIQAKALTDHEGCDGLIVGASVTTQVSPLT